MTTHRTIYWDDKKEIVELFVGKSVRKIENDTLLLSDGTILEIVPNEGCGGCPAGNFYIDELNECDNIITNVELTDTYSEYDIFVYAGHTKINLLSISGGEDNGYYGTGYWINVKSSE